MTKENSKKLSKVKCKYCGSKNIILSGKVNGDNQRYKCKNCNHTFTNTKRKYSNELKAEVIKRYLNQQGIRQIANNLHISNRMVFYWTKRFKEKLKETINDINIPENITDIKLVEIDRNKNKELAELISQSNSKLAELLDDYDDKLSQTNINKIPIPARKTQTSISKMPIETGLLIINNKIIILLFR